MHWSETLIETSFRTIDGLSIRYAESDGGDDHALLLSPWPESLFAFEPTWTRLAQHAHLVAVDLPGFGHSQRRDALMSPRAMGEFVVRIADAFGLEAPHVVGPDVGTGAALFAAALHPGRVRSLVVGSGAVSHPLQITGALKDLVGASGLGAIAALDPRDVVAGSLDLLEKYELSAEAREDYLSSYLGDRFAESCRYVRSYDADLPVLAELLPDIHTPVLIVQGDHDPYIPAANAEFLHERLPDSRLDLIDTGHFAWEDGADEYAALVTAWWDHAGAKSAPR